MRRLPKDGMRVALLAALRSTTALLINTNVEAVEDLGEEDGRAQVRLAVAGLHATVMDGICAAALKEMAVEERRRFHDTVDFTTDYDAALEQAAEAEQIMVALQDGRATFLGAVVAEQEVGQA